MNCKNLAFTHRIMIFLAIAFVFSSTSNAIDVSYLGSITEKLNSPASISISSDKLVVLEPLSNQVIVYTPDGIVDKNIVLSNEAHSLTKTDNDRYLYIDPENNAVMGFDYYSEQQFEHISPDGRFVTLVDLCYANSILYLLDAGKSAIHVYNDGIYQSEIFISDENGRPFKFVSSFEWDHRTGMFYLMDQINSRVCVVSEDGNIIRSISSFGGGDGQISRGGEIALTPDGYILVTDRYQGRISAFDSDGQFISSISDNLNPENRMNVPIGLDVDENGVIYVASYMNAKIDLYYANFAPKISQLTNAFLNYPEEGSILDEEFVTLSAFVEAENARLHVDGFYFEIASQNDSKITLDSSGIVAPDSIYNINQDIQRISVTWPSLYKLEHGMTYHWRVRVAAADTIGEWSNWKSFSKSGLPNVYSLSQNYPNPFNPETIINFSLGTDCDVILEVINLLGERVTNLVDKRLSAGPHQIIWDGTNAEGNRVASGIYFYRLRTNEFVQARKMVLLK